MIGEIIKRIKSKFITDPKLYFLIPYSKGNLGRGYNESIKRYRNTDWVCVMDGDTMFLNNDFGEHVLNIIKKYPDAGLITCLTNRIGSSAQKYDGVVSEESDIRKHKIIADNLHTTKYWEVEKVNPPISGFLMCFKVSTWKKVSGFGNGILHMDCNFSTSIYNLSMPILCMQGLYVFHYYRLNEGVASTAHLMAK
jgi:glycosyltransferase involved in cell wall biosynthesis